MKISKTETNILWALSDGKYVSAQAIAEQIGVSEKTVRYYITSLNNTLQGAGIEVKYGKGFRLVVEDKALFDSSLADDSALDDTVPNGYEARAEYIIRRLLVANNDDLIVEPLVLCEELCVSESTLSICLKQTKSILEGYHIRVVTHRKQGISVEGNEFDIRNCMVDYLSTPKALDEADAEAPKVKQYRKIIATTIIDVLHKNDMSIPEISFDKLVNHTVYARYRNRRGKLIHFSEEEQKEFQRLDPTALTVAQEICDSLMAPLETTFTIDDRYYMAICLVGQRMKRAQGGGSYNLVIPMESQQLAHEILGFLYDTFRVDFRNDFNVMMDLTLHLVSLSVRLNYNLKLDNPLLQDIKSTYSYGYMIACQAAIVIENKFGKVISDEEIGYLGIIFETARERIAENNGLGTKKNIIIVCATGVAGAKLIASQYRKEFGDFLDKIIVCNVHELRDQDFSHIDYLVTTSHVDIDIPVPILETKFALNGEDILELKKRFGGYRGDSLLSAIYPPELFFPDLPFTTKEEVLHFLCNEFVRAGKTETDIYNSVMERESMGTTDIGTVAIPHPFGRIAGESFASVATLREPVFWGRQKVSVVILIAISADEKEDLGYFYQCTSNFMLDPTQVKFLQKNPTYDNLIELLTAE